MDTKIQIFKNRDFGQIRTMVMPDGQIGFVGKDVATVLGYSKPLDALQRHVDEDDSVKYGLMDSLGRTQQTIIINESGLYSLILSSKLPKAREFKHWVTSEVLPQIRKTGGYIPLQEEDNEKTILAKAVLILNKTLEQKDSLLEIQRPKVQFAEAVVSSDGSILIRDLAKLLTQNGITIGQNRLFSWLRQHGYLFKRETRPMQIWVERASSTPPSPSCRLTTAPRSVAPPRSQAKASSTSSRVSSMAVSSSNPKRKDG